MKSVKHNISKLPPKGYGLNLLCQLKFSESDISLMGTIKICLQSFCITKVMGCICEVLVFHVQKLL